MERCSISPVKRLTAHRCLFFLLVAAVTRPSTCNRDDEGEGQVEAFSAQLSVTGQVTPTPIWSVDWGPTLALEDETHHFLSSQEADLYHHGHEVPTTTAEAWLHHQSAPGGVLPQEPLDLLEAPDAEGVADGGSEAEEREPEEVDPQFYVTVTISSLLILTAVIITAKLWLVEGVCAGNKCCCSG
ncbi:uncharacterized protein LOC129845907 isoform X2 [Salvelinus fontinalis]|uniref:uncharacterized protein LOC129845907 isoform X2 n=1 Tax=Salvelinus fontinalis TaxID=8038 RepID=UPI002484FFD6|nr:uncharacterized protein LOC129845907 isoform X2 [Salvelinus fontinalis]